MKLPCKGGNPLHTLQGLENNLRIMIYPNITLEVENDCLRARLKADKEVAQSVMALLDLPDTDMEEVFKLLKQIKG